MTKISYFDLNGRPIDTSHVYNVQDFGASGDGATDDTIAVTNARSAANAAGGGMVFYPAGTYVVGPQILYNYVWDVGAGQFSTTIQLKAGSNADLFSAYTSNINFATAHASGSNTGAVGWGFKDITLDGNKNNQTAGPSYPIRQYGNSWRLQNVSIKNGYSGGIQTDWNGANVSYPLEAQVVNLFVFECGGHGIEVGGPVDSHWVNLMVGRCNGHSFHICPNMSGMVMVNAHGYWNTDTTNGLCFLIEASAGFYSNCLAEGSYVVQVAILSPENSWVGGHAFAIASGVKTMSGIQIGQAAGITPFRDQVSGVSGGLTTGTAPNAVFIDTNLTHCEGTNGAIYAANDGGGNMIRALCWNDAGAAIGGGPNLQHSSYEITMQGNLASDGTVSLGGTNTFVANSTRALAVANRTSDVLELDSYNKHLFLPNGTDITLYSDSYTTRTIKLSGGTVALLQSTSAAAIANNATITTNGVGVARVAPTGNVTGIILGVGIFSGQVCYVINESAFTVTMAASGTSHVADGTSDVIAANTGATYVWDGGTSLWYRC